MVVISLILSVLIGVFAGSFFNNNESFTKKLLIVSAGFLIMICFQELFPSIYSYKNHDIGLYVILGVILQMFLENLTKGFEHGHIHHHEEEKQQILPIALMIGLFIHAFIEGIPLANDHHHGHGFLDSYLLGILVHNIPISFVLGAFLFNRKKETYSYDYCGVIFAILSYGNVPREIYRQFYTSLFFGVGRWNFHTYFFCNYL